MNIDDRSTVTYGISWDIQAPNQILSWIEWNLNELFKGTWGRDRDRDDGTVTASEFDRRFKAQKKPTYRHWKGVNFHIKKQPQVSYGVIKRGKLRNLRQKIEFYWDLFSDFPANTRFDSWRVVRQRYLIACIWDNCWNGIWFFGLWLYFLSIRSKLTQASGLERIRSIHIYLFNIHFNTFAISMLIVVLDCCLQQYSSDLEYNGDIDSQPYRCTFNVTFPTDCP